MFINFELVMFIYYKKILIRFCIKCSNQAELTCIFQKFIIHPGVNDRIYASKEKLRDIAVIDLINRVQLLNSDAAFPLQRYSASSSAPTISKPASRIALMSKSSFR